ncbi:MAG: hypothetical protein AB9882_01070 [Ignavibacteriaceae bacterium]
MKKTILLFGLILSLGLFTGSFGQTSPDYIFGDDNGSSWSWTTGTAGTAGLGSTYKWQFQATADGSLYFKHGETSATTDGSGFWYVGSGSDIQYTTFGSQWNTVYHANMNDAGAFFFHTQTNNYYVLKTKKQAGSDADFAVFDNGVQAPITITSVSGVKTDGILGITAVCSGVKSDNEKVWVRYTTDSWATSYTIEASADLGGGQYKANLAIVSGKVYDYYLFTTINLASAPAEDQADFFTINSNTNSSMNYRYNNGTALNFKLVPGSETFTYLSGASAFTWNNLQANDEEYSTNTNIGFNFNYAGSAYSQFQVTTNGYLVLGGNWTPSSATSSNPGNQLGGIFVRKVIAPLWDDLAVGTTLTDITYSVTGTSGNQVLIVEWKNVKWSYSAAAPSISFQVRFTEATQTIEFLYTTNDPTGTPYTGVITAGTASIGINDASTIQVQNYATKTFQSVNIGGIAGARTYYTSMVWPFEAIATAPDNNTKLTFIPFSETQLSGSYTIGAGGSFTTLSEAATRLNICGINSAVTYNIVAGTYDDIFHIGDISGTSGSNTITVTKQSGTVTFSPLNGVATSNTVTNTDAMFRLDGAQYVVVDGLNFVDNAVNSSVAKKFDIAVLISEALRYTANGNYVVGGRYNVLKNLTIDMNATTGAVSSAALGIRLGTKTSLSDTSITNSYNTIQDCDIQDFWRAAVMMYGNTGANPDRGNVITAVVGRNAFHDVNITSGAGLDTRAIEYNAQADFIIEKTDIYNILNSVNTTNGLWGMRINPAAGTDNQAGTCIIRDNKIWNFDNTTAATTGFVVGIEVNGGQNALDLRVYNNKIYDLFTNGNGACRAVGMQLALGTNLTAYLQVYNNLIYDLRSPRSTSAPSVRGLDIQALSTMLDAKVYYNTILLDNSVPPTIANMSSAGIYWGNYGTAKLDLRNNIIVNTMSAGTLPTTGRATCLWPSANSNMLRLTQTSNNNSYYVGAVPSAVQPIVWDGATSYLTMATYQTAVASGGLGGPRETQSIYANPPFISNVSPYDLKINTATPTDIESGALPLTVPTVDYDGNVRSVTYSDMGAYEFSGTAVADVFAPNFEYTALSNSSSTSNRQISVIIKDKSGVASGANLPRLYYRKSTDVSFVYDDNPTVSGNTHTWTIDYTKVGGGSVAMGDIIQYYIAAQDNAGTPNLGTVPTGGSGTTPPGTTAPLTYLSYVITNVPMAGTYTAGVTLFNKILGRELKPVKSIVTVKELVKNMIVKKAVIPQNPDNSKLMDIVDIPHIDVDQYFEIPADGQPDYIEADVEKEIVTLMDGDKPYTGPLFIEMTASELNKYGVNTSNMEDVKGIYATLTLAVADLVTRGVSAPVVLSLTDAAYSGSETFPINLNTISGTSGVNTITIKPAENNVVTITGASTTAILRVSSTSNVIIDGSNSGGSDRSLNLANTTTGGRGVLVTSVNGETVSNTTVKNLTITTADSTSSRCIVFSDGTTILNNGKFTNVTIKNNDLKKAYDGIYLVGGTVPPFNQSDGLVIEDNLINSTGIDKVKRMGIYMQGFKNFSIKNNQIANMADSVAKGIWIASGCQTGTFEKNYIYNINPWDMGNYKFSGANGMYVSPAITNCNITISNNMIYNITGKGAGTIDKNPTGIFATGYVTGIKIYNNTFYLQGQTLLGSNSPLGSGAAYSACISLSSGTFVDVRNNIFHNELGKAPTATAINGTMGVFAFQSCPAQFSSLDYNNYWLVSVNSTYTSFGHTNGINDLGLSFSQWKTLVGKDANSNNSQTYFTSMSSPFNPHLSGTSVGDFSLRGTPISGITTDIDNEPRDTEFPYMGADETSTPLICKLDLTALIEGFYDGSVLVSDTVTVELRNGTTPFTLIQSVKSTLNTSGAASPRFSLAQKSTDYYLVIKHRNSIETWSKLPQQFSPSLAYDFSSAQTQAYGDNMIQKGTKWCIYGGDVNQDGIVDGSDITAVDNDATNWAGGYLSTDTNGDEIVDGSDITQVDNNATNWIGTINPVVGILKDMIKSNKNKQNLINE